MGGSAVVTCSASDDGATLSGVRTADGSPLGRWAVPSPQARCPSFVVGPGGRVLASIGFPDVRVVDPAAGTADRVDALSGSSWAVTDMAQVTPDGSRLVVSGVGWTALADLSAPGALTPAMAAADLLPDGSGLVGVTADGRRLVADPTTVARSRSPAAGSSPTGRPRTGSR